MSDLITVQGVVLSAAPVGEYDRRIVLLTRERGKIAAFAKGARRLNSPLMAAASPFVFGSFSLYEGRTSYNLNRAEITHHFVELASRQPGVYYGYYFLELADYFGREGNDEKEMMNLLYVTVRALMNEKISLRLVRCIFEFRLMVIQGLMPQIFECAECGKVPEKEDRLFFSLSAPGVFCGSCGQVPGDAFRISYSALYTLQYIASAPLKGVFGFTVEDSLLRELEKIIYRYTEQNIDRRLKALEILKVMVEK